MPSFGNRQCPRRNMNIYDVNETQVPSPTPGEDVFHIGQHNDALLSHVTYGNPLPPGHLHRLLSNNDTPSKTTSPPDNNTTSMVNNTFTK